MFGNEQGFTMAEGILAFNLILLLSLSLFPVMFGMLVHLDERKKEMTAARLLYEYVEQASHTKDKRSVQRVVRQTSYHLYFQFDEKGEWSACVEYEGWKTCTD